MSAALLALTLGLSACGGSGSDIASPGVTNPGTGPGGGGGGGGGGTGPGSASCPTGTTNAGGIGASGTICVLTGAILTNLTLPRVAGVAYRISGRVDVGRDVGADGSAAGGQAAVLTIEEGVTLFGDEAGDLLIVNRGSRIMAQGSSTQPIIFTSREDVEGTNDPATANRQWGGVILLGRAPIRGCNTAVTQGTVDCQNAIEGVLNATGSNALYGGATPTDNSGTFSYVQIRYPGAFLTSASAGDDLNGLTLGGVGSGTTIDHVQIHNSGDDGIEIFGGTVNMKYVVITGALDDSLDCDEGWQGKVQFVAVRQSPLSGTDRIVECSNRTVASSGGTLNTNPTIANFTFIGSVASGTAQQGVTMNNTGGSPGATGRYINGVVTGSNICLVADAAAAVPVLTSVLMDCPQPYGAPAQAAISAGTNVTTNVASTLSGVLPGPNELAATPVNPASIDSFFTAANYVGAFSPTETVLTNWAAGWTIQIFASTGCPAGTTQNGSLNGQPRCVLSGVVAGDVRLTSGNIYQLAGRVDVGVDRGADGTGGAAASLVIDAGVTLFGNSASDMLIVNRGSKIFVNGTASAPVIMTSLPDVTNSQVNPTTASREWAGLIVLGRAPIRGCNTAVAQGSVDCQNAIEGVLNATGANALYGGATANDDSGRINFLQIRYPGAFLTSAAAGDDLNGLSLGGVGSATEIENVQIHNSGDDGIEIFGGAVNLRNVIITGAEDDSLDFDEGWRGFAQFVIVIQRAVTGTVPDRLIEGSNRTVSSLAGTLDTFPTIANFTFLGAPGTGQGVVLNNTGGTPGGSARLMNGVVAFSNSCFIADAANTSPQPVLASVLLDCPANGAGATTTAALGAATNTTTNVANSLISPAGGRPFINGPTETGRTAANLAAVSAFFAPTDYIGAVRNSSDTWWQAWSCGLQTGSPC